MTRREDWPERLFALLESRVNVPFEWGVNDCALLAADAIREMTDADPLGGLRGTWTTDREALDKIAEVGGLEQAARDRFGEPGLINYAQRGDLVLFESAGRDCFGICVGTHIAAPGEQGLVYMPMDCAKSVWRI